MPPTESFEDLMERLRSGSNDAATEVFQRYARRLLALAKSRLSELVQQKDGPEDVLQSVFRSFFRRTVEGEFEVGDWQNLWTILTVITVRKCANRGKFFTRQRRDARREQTSDDNDPGGEVPMLGREPTPEAAALLTETVDQLMRRLDERDQQILSLKLQGYSVPEASEHLGCSERTVQRVLRQIREHLLGQVQD